MRFNAFAVYIALCFYAREQRENVFVFAIRPVHSCKHDISQRPKRNSFKFPPKCLFGVKNEINEFSG